MRARDGSRHVRLEVYEVGDQPIEGGLICGQDMNGGLDIP
jgi:hypothetical protein